MAYFICGWTCGWQLKLCDPLSTRAIPERLRDKQAMIRRRTNLRLLYSSCKEFRLLFESSNSCSWRSTIGSVLQRWRLCRRQRGIDNPSSIALSRCSRERLNKPRLDLYERDPTTRARNNVHDIVAVEWSNWTIERYRTKANVRLSRRDRLNKNRNRKKTV